MRFVRQCLLTGALLVSPGFLQPQDLIVGSGPGGAVRLAHGDMAILEVREPRKDLPCSLQPIDPVLGFDLRFHSGYAVSIPLRDLAGPGNLLTIRFRVIPEGSQDQAAHFLQRLRVPEIEEEAKGEATFQGVFDLGPGKYHIDWMMRNRAGRVCSHYWDVEAKLSWRDQEIALAIVPSAVQAAESEHFQPEPPTPKRLSPSSMHVKVLVNFAPQKAESGTMRAPEVSALVSVLRRVSREPSIGKYSLVAFNLQEQRIVHRQDNVDHIDFPMLGQALESLELGTVDLDVLMRKHGDTEFLEELVRSEMAEPQHANALVFVGPKAMLDENVPEDVLREIGKPDFPVFYLNCNLEPHRTPWRDAIGRVVKFFKGTEFLVSRPRDVFFAVRDVVSRIASFRPDSTPGESTLR